MKKYITACLIFLFCLLFISCTTPPEKYFTTAVLNINTLHGFADDGFSRELESPSVKLAGNNNETVQMKRSEVINSKIEQTEENLSDIEGLRKTNETENMIAASVALYNYVLPVYKGEYVQLAELYDNGAPKAQIELLTKSIHDKYFQGFSDLYEKLIGYGKVYAEKNNINVKWDIKTSPN